MSTAAPPADQTLGTSTTAAILGYGAFVFMIAALLACTAVPVCPRPVLRLRALLCCELDRFNALADTDADRNRSPTSGTSRHQRHRRHRRSHQRHRSDRTRSTLTDTSVASFSSTAAAGVTGGAGDNAIPMPISTTSAASRRPAPLSGGGAAAESAGVLPPSLPSITLPPLASAASEDGDNDESSTSTIESLEPRDETGAQVLGHESLRRQTWMEATRKGWVVLNVEPPRPGEEIVADTDELPRYQVGNGSATPDAGTAGAAGQIPLPPSPSPASLLDDPTSPVAPTDPPSLRDPPTVSAATLPTSPSVASSLGLSHGSEAALV
ncbi:hypothetical protein BC828DRAFT_394307 [Blastocladiella britannica]|nr:hypothetical protein BC828DRAFT_394307 [Blastocladiella britannica]